MTAVEWRHVKKTGLHAYCSPRPVKSQVILIAPRLFVFQSPVQVLPERETDKKMELIEQLKVG